MVVPVGPSHGEIVATGLSLFSHNRCDPMLEHPKSNASAIAIVLDDSIEVVFFVHTFIFLSGNVIELISPCLYLACGFLQLNRLIVRIDNYFLSFHGDLG